MSDPIRFTCANAPLKMLMCLAYDVQFFQVIGDDWISVDGFDIASNVPQGTSKQEFREMLQSLLAERLGLEIRREERRFPAYTLSQTKSGSRLRSSDSSALADVKAVGPASTSGVTDGIMHLPWRRPRSPCLHMRNCVIC